ncbi:MAG: Tex family protein [Cyanobacteriota bacterium]
MNEKIINFILEDIDFTTKKFLSNTINLIESGATVPFISRYRKEQTNNLNEEQIRTIQSKLEYFKELEKRKETILNTISEQGKLTDELKIKITNCKEKPILEDLYLPYKPKKRTKATIAKEKGLEPLAIIILDQQESSGNKDNIIKPFINPEKGVETIEDAISGAIDIIAEIISDNANLRNWIRNFTLNNAILTVKVKKGFEKETTKFEMYYNYEEPLKKIPSHRMLAINRGCTEKVLGYSINIDIDKIINYIRQTIIKNKNTLFSDELKKAIDESYKRLISSSIEKELINIKTEEADEEAIKVFAKNLRSLLLAPPAGSNITLGIDPGFRTGCKIVVIDKTGKFLENTTIFPNPPQNEIEKSAKTIINLISKHQIELVAIGNATASRETDAFISQLIKDNNLKVTKVIVSESGASIYSASETAQKEFPELDVTVRGAISIARRLQDPLAELVKIDPKSIGVGQYQHDVNQPKLKQALDSVVESCVNYVGVELNTASEQLLSYVSGIGPTLAKNIVEYRNKNKTFKSRKELLKVSKLGPKVFEQSAGFLRIRNSSNPLDRSAVHPESYYIVEKISKNLNVDIEKLITNQDLINKIRPEDYIDEKAGMLTLKDIVEELKKPGRDPRDEFITVKFNDNIKEITDLKPGMELEGTVTNVTKFGAFVNIGLKKEGLVHISQLADQFVKDPNDIVQPGDIVNVRVIAIDIDHDKINLSMKS